MTKACRWSAIGGLALLSAAAGVATRASAQQQSARGRFSDNFTGQIAVQDGADLRTSRIRFEAGARTNWHVHSAGQVLAAEEGRGLAQEQGGQVQEFAPDRPVYLRPNVPHWHGATPDQAMVQITMYSGTLKWMQPVTDEEYSRAAAARAQAGPSLEQGRRAVAELRRGRIERPSSYDALTPEQKRYVDGILDGPRGNIPPPLAVMLASPGLGDLVQRGVAYARFSGREGYSSLPPKLNELAILMAARMWTGEYVWNSHHAYAVKVGLSPEVVEAVRVGKRPASMEGDVKAVYSFLDEMLTTRRVSDATLRAVRAVLGGDRGVVDLVGTFALYSISSMMVMVDESPLPEGVAPYLPPLK